MKIKNLLLALSLPVVVFSLSMDDRVTELEKKFAAATTKTEMGDFGAKNADGMPHNTWTGLHVQFGLNYLLPEVKGTEFALKYNMSPTAISATNNEFKATTVAQDFDWNLGFRVGAGYKLQDYGYDLSLDYMYQRPSSTTKVATGSPETLEPIGIVEAGNRGVSQVAEATQSFDIKFDQLDLTLASGFFTNRYFTLTGLAGLRSHWLNFDKKIVYAGGELGNNNWIVKSSSKFWGIGPEAGFTTNWNLGRGISIFSNVALTYLYGTVKTTNYQEDNTQSVIKYTINDSEGSGIPELNGTLGLAYGSYLGGRDYYVSVRAGYDFGYYWNVFWSNLPGDGFGGVYAPTSYKNDMSFHGVTVQARLDF